MDRKLLILLVLFGTRGAALIASEPPSSLSDGSESPSSLLSEGESPSTSPQEAVMREKLVKVLKIVHAPATGISLDETAKTLIKQADAPQGEINSFLASLSAEQIWLLNKIVSCNKIGAQLFLGSNEKTTHAQLPPFVRRIFKKPKQEDTTEETEEY